MIKYVQGRRPVVLRICQHRIRIEIDPYGCDAVEGYSLGTFRTGQILPRRPNIHLRGRMLNIFDPHFGSLSSSETAQRMSDQTLHALDQVGRLILIHRQAMSLLHEHLPEHFAERSALVSL